VQRTSKHKAIPTKKKIERDFPTLTRFGAFSPATQKKTLKSTPVFETARLDGFQMRLDSSRKIGQSMLA